MSAIIDWVSCTFAMREEEVDSIILNLTRVTGLVLRAVERRSRPGFKDGIQVQAFVNLELVNFCVLAWGGDNQNGRALLEFSGSSCGCIENWSAVQAFLQSLDEPRLTRVDTALDLFKGEHTVDDCKDWYNKGEFTMRGRKPTSSLSGDWINEQEGRTFYVGKLKNGKELCCYEKGKQLGDKESAWTRFEVRFSNRDRVIPFEILTQPSVYFVAAYPALEHIVQEAGEVIKTVSTTAEATISTILRALKRTYGKWFHVLKKSDLPIHELVEGITVKEIPHRIQAAAVVADVLRDTTKSAFNHMRN